MAADVRLDREGTALYALVLAPLAHERQRKGPDLERARPAAKDAGSVAASEALNI